MKMRSVTNPAGRAITVADHPVDGAEPLTDVVLRRFDALWRARAALFGMPGSGDIDLAEIVDMLPHVMVVDVVRDGGAVRFATRMVGQHHVDLFGRATAWNALLGSEGAMDGAVHMLDVVEQQRPRYARGRVEGTQHGVAVFERITYPLSSDGLQTDRLISILVPHYSRPSRLASLFAWF